jgi:hypothetical protein
MLKQFSAKIRLCYERAADAKERADATNDPEIKAEFLAAERRWLTLARSYGFTESLEDFTRGNSEKRRRLDERLAVACSGFWESQKPQRAGRGRHLGR